MRELVFIGGRAVIIDAHPLKATRRQVRLALGEDGCAAMDAAADDPTLPWAMREQMKSSHEWHRDAPEIDEFGWVLGLSADDIDALFSVAATL